MKKKVFFTALLTFLLITAWIFCPRKSTVILSQDLIPAQESIPPNENGYYILEHFELSGDEQSEIERVLERWNKDSINDVIEKHSRALVLFDQSQNLPFFQIPSVQPFNSEPLTGEWKALIALNVLKARQLFLNGEEEEAFKKATALIEFGRRIQEGGGLLMHYYFGAGAKSLGTRTLMDLALKSTNRTALEKELMVLTNSRDSSFAISNAFKAEYVGIMDMVNMTKQMTAPGQNLSAPEQLIWNASSPVLINVKKTGFIVEEITRASLENIPKPWSAMNTNLAPPAPGNNFKAVLSGNSMGLILLGMLMPNYLRALQMNCEQKVDNSAAQLVFALRCHELKHGKLPEKLGDLVPEFLTAIPLDDFDGRPLRYSKEKKVVYSVGEDLLDSGGIKSDAKQKRLDIVFPLEFLQPEPKKPGNQP